MNVDMEKTIETMLQLREKAKLIEKAADSKKALDAAMLDLSGISDVADVFMIFSGTSRQHVQTIANGIEDELRKSGDKDYHIEGYENAKWTLIDTGDIVVHIFSHEAREYYAIEKLWADAELFVTGKERADQHV